MSLTIQTRTDIVVVSQTLVERYTQVLSGSTQHTLDMDLLHLQYILDYMSHHQHKESPVPVYPTQAHHTMDVFPDPWDATFMKKIMLAEQDVGLLKFSHSVAYFGMPKLQEKIGLAIVLTLVGLHGLDHTALHAAFMEIQTRQLASAEVDGE